MKPPIESSPNRDHGLAGTARKPAEIEPPKEPFINLSDTGPVNPAKFQRFIVPMEFLEKANALDLAHLETDELDASASQHAPAVPPPAMKPEQQATTRMNVARRPVGLFMQWSLTGKMPTRIKIVLAAVFGVLILLWAYLRTGTPSTVSGDMPTVNQSASSVTLPAMRDIAVMASVTVGHKSPIDSAPPSLNTDHPAATEAPGTSATIRAASTALMPPAAPNALSGATLSPRQSNHPVTTKPMASASEPTPLKVEPTAPSDTPALAGKRPLLVPR